MKQMNNNISNPFSFGHKHNHVFVKFGVCFLLLGLSYRLFFSTSIDSSPVVDTDTAFVAEDTLSPPVGNPPIPGDLPVNESQTYHNEKCDIFTGEWVPDPTGPFYTNNSCHSIEDHQNCMRNGRPDSGYIYWRWKPRECELPKFNPGRFLDFMRDKSIAFIGDSISRNQVQSLVCTLSEVEKAVEVYHDEEYRSKRWSFPSHNFSVSVIWTPFLIKAAVFEDNNGVSSGTIQLHLDQLDEVWTEQYKNFDYAVLAGGKWYLKTAIYYENTTMVGCHNCEKNITELGFEYAYRKALQLVFNFVTHSNHKVHILFRTSTPDHFENGEWNTGGYCNQTVPFKEGEVDISDVDRVMRDIELEEFENAEAIGSEKGSTFKLFDTTHLSLLRPDGHPGVYRMFQPYAGKDKSAKVQNDCLHWCLPGPIDSWNDLIMEMMLN
ncbi:unnamed protein product [Ilex paraguariensis]|uniref:Trichome birefringence-like N-terminal domain-containing protein n=1 Tax=Ilex paraguariensis TaxID=185542 RepID=A0ABC8T8R8_9AQUA